jgi:cytoskeletal protein CcmA (bactofilin family)
VVWDVQKKSDGKSMLGKKNDGGLTSNGQTLNTIIGRGTIFEGKMKVENSVRIDGSFKGELTCTGSLTISQTGEVDAQLEGKDIYVNGSVHGTLRAEKVRLDTQARFVGDIQAAALQIAEGAVFHGRSTMDSNSQTPEPEPVSTNGQAKSQKNGKPAVEAEVASKN